MLPQSSGISIGKDAYQLFIKVARCAANIGRHALGIKLPAPLDVIPQQVVDASFLATLLNLGFVIKLDLRNKL